MKKIILYSIALLTTLVYAAACSESFMKFFVDGWTNEKRPEILALDKWKYGDLYGLSYLKNFKIPAEPLYSDERIVSTGEKRINLWVIGDSSLIHALDPKKENAFLYDVKLKDYWWKVADKEPRTAEIEKGKRNILIIETGERFVRETFAKKAGAEEVLGIYLTMTDESRQISEKNEFLKNTKQDQKTLRQKLGLLSQERIIPVNFTQNIETILFGYEFFLPLKELKAELNYRLFSKLPAAIYISNNEKNLFLRETIDVNSTKGSFTPLSDEELTQIAENLNFVSDGYKRKGFDEVFFSIVPSSATIINPENMAYNNLIPRLQNHPELRVKVIDVYSKMKTVENPADLYWTNDSHWNSNGFRIWIDETNRIFKNLVDVQK